jgi:hypothetical protein
MPEQNKSPLEIEGKKQRDQLLPKNEYNELKTMPTNEAQANADANGIGESGSPKDKQARQSNIQKNKFNESNKYPNF